MDLLKEGIEKNFVIATEQKNKMRIDGREENFTVYKVKLDLLYYNDQNDRIATWISEYKATNGNNSLKNKDLKEYNNIIENFIIQSNQDEMNKTQKNIETVNQRVPGVVLSDGRIIDGNRRVTCLRRLSKKDEKFGYFETVILPHNYQDNAKQIKMLELAIQHGEERKVEYNVVDRAVGIYKDIEEDGLLTIEEYARTVNSNVSEIKKNLFTAKLMVEFLDFINASKKYFIVRELQLYYPLDELSKLKNSCKTNDEFEDLKNAVFSNMIMKPGADLTRYVRSFREILVSKYKKDFLEEQNELAEKVLNLLSEEDTSIEVIRTKLRTNTEIQEELDRINKKYLERAKYSKTKNQLVEAFTKIKKNIEDLDYNIIDVLNDNEKNDIIIEIEKIENLLSEIKGYF